MNRRSFLQTILIAGCAPAIVRADSLMQVINHNTRLSVVNWLVVGWTLDGAVLIEQHYYPPTEYYFDGTSNAKVLGVGPPVIGPVKDLCWRREPCVARL